MVQEQVCELLNGEFIIKRNFQFLEREACKRLILYIQVVLESEESITVFINEVIYKNIELLKENYQELTI